MFRPAPKAFVAFQDISNKLSTKANVDLNHPCVQYVKQALTLQNNYRAKLEADRVAEQYAALLEHINHTNDIESLGYD
jgi:hypothetical protein